MDSETLNVLMKKWRAEYKCIRLDTSHNDSDIKRANNMGAMSVCLEIMRDLEKLGVK